MGKKANRTSQKGDTLVEVILAMAIFAVVSLLATNLMNDGLMTAQKNLETSMAKNAMDSQAETLRYVYNGFTKSSASGSSGGGTNFKNVWKKITSLVVDDNRMITDLNELDDCEQENPVGHFGGLTDNYSFVLNPRGIISPKGIDKNVSVTHIGFKDNEMPMSVSSGTIDNNAYLQRLDTSVPNPQPKIVAAPAYPRLVYNNMVTMANNLKEVSTWRAEDVPSDDFFLGGAGGDNPAYGDGPASAFSGFPYMMQSNTLQKSEGLWIRVQAGKEGSDFTNSGSIFEGVNYYDFYIRTCWNAVGQKTPSTMTSIVRLYNTEVKNSND